MRRHRGRPVPVLLAVLLPLLGVLGGLPARAETQPCSALAHPLLQRWDTRSGGELLTVSAREAAAARGGFPDDRGVLARVAVARGPGLAPVWRYARGTGELAWAADGPPARALVRDGYRKRTVGFYASPTAAPCLRAFVDLQRGGRHRTAAGVTVGALVAMGWTRGPVVFHAPAGPAPASPPPVAVPPVAVPTPSPAPTTDRRFTLAVLPDTQIEVDDLASPLFAERVRWLLDNRTRLDLRYALQVGDLVDWGNVVPAQLDKVSAELRPLEAVLPWAGAVGNHDTAAVCVGGSACPGANTLQTVRDTSAYDRVFPPSRFPDLGGTFEPGKVANSYRTFSAGGVDWLVLSLELWPRPEVVAWGHAVVEAHPHHDVIVLTHAYLDIDGSIGTTNGGYGATSPQYLYDHLVTLSPNVVMVLSGHVGGASSRTDTGVHGNRIVSLMQTYHSTTNPVRIVEIDTGAGTVTSTVYAPSSRSDYPQDRTSTDGMTFTR